MTIRFDTSLRAWAIIWNSAWPVRDPFQPEREDRSVCDEMLFPKPSMLQALRSCTMMHEKNEGHSDRKSTGVVF